LFNLRLKVKINLQPSSTSYLDKSITIESIDPIVILGINDKKIALFRKYFPRLKIVARGNEIKVIGDDEMANVFEEKLQLAIEYYLKFNTLTLKNLETILEDEFVLEAKEEGLLEDQVLVYGNRGLQVKARTINQKRVVKSVNTKDLVFAIGPAGTGKTYTAVALAVRALKNKQVKRIILTRPAVEAGEHLGFLPGDLKDKLDPYLQPLYDALNDMIPPERLADFMEQKIIQIAPLAFMRGRTLDNAFVILDEAQNATRSQLKMFLTRMGRSAKFVITGDLSQIDLPRRNLSGLLPTLKILENVEEIDEVFLDSRDIVRHPLVDKVIKAFDKLDKEEEDANNS